MVGVELKGANELMDLLKRWPAHLHAELVKAAEKGGALFEQAAKRRSPVGPGGKRRRGGQQRLGITHAVEESRGAVTGVTGTNVPYSVYSELTETFHVDAPGRGGGAGTPESPYTTWEALRKRGGRGQTMPWLRAAWLDVRERVFALFQAALEPPG